MEHITRYFPKLDKQKVEKLQKFSELIVEYNSKINLISRKDTENIEINHILHSLSIAKFIDFKTGSKIIDIGTGGGFPGVPLAIVFPDSEFLLVDSIEKKIKVVSEIIEKLDLKNAEALNCRIETLKIPKVNFIVSRAVAPISQLYKWSKHLISSDNFNNLKNGYILLKGGDLTEEKKDFINIFKNKNLKEISLSCFFKEEFFETKKLIYLNG